VAKQRTLSLPAGLEPLSGTNARKGFERNSGAAGLLLKKIELPMV
jgi:hypothetical protein